MRKRAKRKLRQSGILPFEFEEGEGVSPITSFAGLPLLVEAFRACGAVEALPEGVEQISLRADSAAYDHDVLNWCRDEAGITLAWRVRRWERARASPQAG